MTKQGEGDDDFVKIRQPFYIIRWSKRKSVTGTRTQATSKKVHFHLEAFSGSTVIERRVVNQILGVKGLKTVLETWVIVSI